MNAVDHTVGTMLGVCLTVKWVSHSVSVILASVVMASTATLSVSVCAVSYTHLTLPTMAVV